MLESETVYDFLFILLTGIIFVLYFLSSHPYHSNCRSNKSLICVVPDVSVFTTGWRHLRRVTTVPLALVRVDGLIYRTSFSFTYSPELLPPPPPPPPQTSPLSCRGVGGAPASRGEGAAGCSNQDDFLLETIHQEFTRANFHLFMQN